MIRAKSTTKPKAKAKAKPKKKPKTEAEILQECIDLVVQTLTSQGLYSPEMQIQAEVVGTDLYVYRTLRNQMLKSEKFIEGSTGQQVLNPIYDQLTKKSDILRKGLASLQMNKEKMPSSVAKADIQKKNQNKLVELAGKIEGIK